MKASPKSRRGWSLMEMVVVMPLLAMVLSTSAMLLTTLMRSQGMLWANLHEQSARTRLAVQLRTDAHAASNASCASPQVCVFLHWFFFGLAGKCGCVGTKVPIQRSKFKETVVF